MELDPRPVQYKGLQWLLIFATLTPLANIVLYEWSKPLLNQLPYLASALLALTLWGLNRWSHQRKRFRLALPIDVQGLLLGLALSTVVAIRLSGADGEPAMPIFSAYIMFVFASVLGLHSADRALLLCIIPPTLVLLWPSGVLWWQELAVLAIALYLGLAARRQINLWMRMSQAQLRQNKRLLEKFRTLSNQDALTGLANRRYFDLRLEQSVNEAKRSKNALSLILLDVDYFKRYNDHFGHQAGDECLRIVAQIMRRSSRRQSDTLARLGGEEFVLLLPNTDKRGAQRLAEEIQSRLKDANLDHPESGIATRVTLSQGIAQWHPGLSGSALLHQADKAMYEAKLSGRNTINAA
ncbi:GGDEF domain-containing protein [Ferrimonas balearica]|uniref:GGDEF domain-containing protein n=1 Tax=Ferrimonas balearica TaxID=44012 RepID=UPI001C99AF4A|nr:GGDEF domain-containing protein [Ferrimonas balearica]MBY5922735.1 GGDEF domain-containing protein [Ferrimonas balearica]MBY5995719.1 GGDEF domain-containing protein [Ferrimonas balearica]